LQPKIGCISETVRDRAKVAIKHLTEVARALSYDTKITDLKILNN